jgi:hypothetical protein
MKKQGRILASVLALVFAAVLAGGAFAQGTAPAKAPAGPAPRAVVRKMTIEAGEVLEGQVYQTTFYIRNAGDAELQILSVRPG